MKRFALSLSTSLVLMLAAFPLTSLGTTDGPEFLMWLGLALLGIGGLIPLARRFVNKDEPEKPPRRTGQPEDVRC